MLSSRHNQRRRVRRWHAGEDGRVDDEDIVRAVDARVGVDDGCSVVDEARVGAHFGGAEPVCEKGC